MSLLPSAMQRLSYEVGLGFDVSEKLGADWTALCEAWIEAESALMTAGGPPLALENRGVPVPPSLIRWSHTRVAKNYEDIDYPTIGIEVLNCGGGSGLKVMSEMLTSWSRRSGVGVV